MGSEWIETALPYRGPRIGQAALDRTGKRYHSPTSGLLKSTEHKYRLLKPERWMASGNALVLVPILWVVVTVGWVPMLLSERLRDLCGRWPTGRVVLNYPLFVTVVVGTHVLIFLAVSIRVPAGSPLLPAWAFGSTFLVAVVSWLIVAVVLPATRDMSLPSNSRLLLAVGAVWYGVLVSIVFAVLALLLFALFFPG